MAGPELITGCGTFIADCACGIASRVIDRAGKLAVTPEPDTLTSGCFTIALRFLELYCHTCAVPAGVKLARLMVSAVTSLVVLLRTRTVSAESERCAA